MINWTWTFPWNDNEVLCGILTANNIEVDDQDAVEKYTASIISIGLIFGRVDILFNKETKEE
ncbi:MAG: hypothetical protein ACSLE0_23320 [Chitinophagaceae bacterium]